MSIQEFKPVKEGKVREVYDNAKPYAFYQCFRYAGVFPK